MRSPLCTLVLGGLALCAPDRALAQPEDPEYRSLITEAVARGMIDAGLEDERLRGVLHDYFAWATFTPMYHHSSEDIPEDISVPHWSWDGREL